MNQFSRPFNHAPSSGAAPGSSPTFTNLTITGTINNSSLSASQAVFTDGSKNFVSNTISGTGSVAMTASPTFTGTLNAAAIATSGQLSSGGSTGSVVALNVFQSSSTGTLGDAAASFRQDGTNPIARFLRSGGTEVVSIVPAGISITGTLGVSALETITDAGNTSAFKFMSFVSNGAECGNVIRVAQTSVVTFTTSSDYRVKETFGPLVNAGQLLRDLKVYDGMFNNDGYHKPMVLAHEVQAVTPWAVFGDKDAVDDEGNPDYQKVSVGAHEPLLIAGWQELDQRLSVIEQQLKITPRGIDPLIMAGYATRASDKIQSEAAAQVAVEARKAEVKTMLAQLFQ